VIVLPIIRAGFRKNRAGKPRRENQAGKTGPVWCGNQGVLHTLPIH